jgi:hypothetical protein
LKKINVPVSQAPGPEGRQSNDGGAGTSAASAGPDQPASDPAVVQAALDPNQAPAVSPGPSQGAAAARPPAPGPTRGGGPGTSPPTTGAPPAASPSTAQPPAPASASGAQPALPPVETAPPTGAFGGYQTPAPGSPVTSLVSALNTIGDQGVIPFDPSQVTQRKVTIVRNFSLNVTDNNSAALQDRIIPLEYYHFFDTQRVYPGQPFNFSPTGFVVLAQGPANNLAARLFPIQHFQTKVSTNDDRYVFGFEKILAPRLSVLVRQSVVTIDQPDLTLQQGSTIHQLGGTRSGWGDLQIVPKYLLYSSPKCTVTTGVGLVIPVGTHNDYHQFGNSAFVFQPNILFLALPTERLVIQGGLEYDVPAANNLDNATLFRWMLFGGYRVYSNPGSKCVESVYPLIECHGSDLLGRFTQTTVNITTGLRVNLCRRVQVGVGFAFPVTVQRQFSDEILANVNLFF